MWQAITPTGSLNCLRSTAFSACIIRNRLFFSTLADADAFLNDVMPYSSETIVREEKNLTDKVKMVTYSSPMGTGQTSVIYLIEDPEKGFYVGYNEGGN